MRNITPLLPWARCISGIRPMGTQPLGLSPPAGEGWGGLAVYLGEELFVVLRALHEILHILHSLYGIHLGEHLAY